jgi:hypothetical protein
MPIDATACRNAAIVARVNRVLGWLKSERRERRRKIRLDRRHLEARHSLFHQRSKERPTQLPRFQ